MKPCRVRFLLVILLALAAYGCGTKPASTLPVVQMQIGAESFNLEIASTPYDQEIGLMHRESLDPDHGMIFVFSQPESNGFWNHDVHFPLDLIFLDVHGVIVSLKHMDAYSEVNVGSDQPYYYTIELNAGTAHRLGLKVGDQLAIPQKAQTPPPQSP
jgi:uncharacterized protein